ncbi:uncharacterized protein MELLADRAFT_78613 [Melampsora larici-populina 98AG31]|uniref:Zn(2)-C6 fungal-type domain-containing protein n=1 Tax=Melampsora larici-populina (strain 98AG31 / pathotype 3-4-7) TaxID=747676 RepID=F4RWJ3_MELLP|nr:uncharacterized protein MELLADRAFT_78613 [Melampsora larici-populina 98AG31]EGG03310.1 hypothetical protein MELLADRAFT_78613 [Melampsora larici-populina 98AG31]
MNEGLPHQLNVRDPLSAHLFQFSPSVPTPSLPRTDWKGTNLSPALPFRTGNYVASSASSSASSSSSELYRHPLPLNLSSIRDADPPTSLTPSHSTRLPPLSSDVERCYEGFQNQNLPIPERQENMPTQAVGTQATFGLDQMWALQPGRSQATTPSLGVEAPSMEQLSGIRTKKLRISDGGGLDMCFPTSAPHDGSLPSSMTPSTSPVELSRNHYTHRPSYPATFSANEVSPPQGQRLSRNDNCARTFSMTVGDGSALRGSRAPPPPALNAQAGWQHRSTHAPEFSPVSASYHPFSPFASAFSRPESTASPHTAPRTSELFDASQLAHQLPSQLSLRSPVQDRAQRHSFESHSELSPITPHSSHPFSSSGFDHSGTKHAYTPSSMGPCQSSDPATLLYALCRPSDVAGIHGNVASFLGSLSGPEWPSPPKSAPPSCDQFGISHNFSLQAQSLRPMGLTKKGNPRLPRQLISCDFCRIRKLRCDGKRPCAHCSRRSRECNYQPSVRKRGKGKKNKENELASSLPRQKAELNHTNDQAQPAETSSPFSGTRSGD